MSKPRQTKLTPKQITARKSVLEAMLESLAIREMVEQRIKSLEGMTRSLARSQFSNANKDMILAMAKFCDVEIDMLNDVMQSSKRLSLALGRTAEGVK